MHNLHIILLLHNDENTMVYFFHIPLILLLPIVQKSCVLKTRGQPLPRIASSSHIHSAKGISCPYKCENMWYTFCFTLHGRTRLSNDKEVEPKMTCSKIVFQKYLHAMAGNPTRVNCLEGSYAHHYTTDALQYIKVATKWKFFCSARKRRKSVKPNFNQRLMDFCSTEQLQSTSLTTELSKL